MDEGGCWNAVNVQEWAVAVRRTVDVVSCVLAARRETQRVTGVCAQTDTTCSTTTTLVVAHNKSPVSTTVRSNIHQPVVQCFDTDGWVTGRASFQLPYQAVWFRSHPHLLLKECASVLVFTITNIVSLSLTSDQFHPILKESVINIAANRQKFMTLAGELSW